MARRWTQQSILDGYHAWVAEHGRQPSVADWRAATLSHPNFSTVRTHFGSWNNFIIAAGGQPNPQRRASRRNFARMPQWTGWQLLAVYRQRAGLSQRQVALAAHIDPAVYGRMEKGRPQYVNPHIGTLLSVAQALGVPPAVLLEYRPSKVDDADGA